MLALIEAKQTGKMIPFARKIWPMELVSGGSSALPPPQNDDAMTGREPAESDLGRARQPSKLRSSAAGR